MLSLVAALLVEVAAAEAEDVADAALFPALVSEALAALADSLAADAELAALLAEVEALVSDVAALVALPAAALALDELFEEKATLLVDHPRMGRRGREADTRELVAHHNYILVYDVTGDGVRVLRVLHAARQWPPPDARVLRSCRAGHQRSCRDRR